MITSKHEDMIQDMVNEAVSRTQQYIEQGKFHNEDPMEVAEYFFHEMLERSQVPHKSANDFLTVMAMFRTLAEEGFEDLQ